MEVEEMLRKANTIENREFKSVLVELEINPYRKFNVAFSLMSVIPFLVFFYLLVARLFTFDILIGNIGLIMFVSLVISLGGFSEETLQSH